MFDLLLRGGWILDGEGGAPRREDLGIAAGRVAALGSLADAAARRILDLDGARVLPGFVDVHTHYDLCLDWPELSAHCLRQGITSAIGGNCGLGSAAPGEVLAHARAARLGMHFGVLAPLGPLRSRVVPRAEDRPARASELPRVEAEVARALAEGALGVSWGPYHANALMDPTELGAALGAAARAGKPFCVHRRSEGAEGLAATREVVDLARAAGTRLQVSHLKAAGRTHWGQFEPVLACLEAARRDLDLAVDVYPYDASLTYLSAIVPTELKAAGRLHAQLERPEGRRAAAAGIARWFRQRQGPEAVVLLEPALPRVPRGATLRAAARALGLDDPIEAALRLIAADPQATGGWAIYRHMMAPEQVEQVLDLSWAAVASDAVPEEDGQAMSAHPRAYATFSRALARAARRGDAALADAVRRCTRFPAQRFGLDRGRLVPGAPADLLVMRELEEGASYEAPAAYPRGIEWVVVAGRVALAGGQLTDEAAGELLVA